MSSCLTAYETWICKNCGKKFYAQRYLLGDKFCTRSCCAKFKGWDYNPGKCMNAIMSGK